MFHSAFNMAMKEAGAGTKCYVPDETYVWLPAQILREIKSTDPKKPAKTLVLRVSPPPGDRHVSVGDEERVLDFNDSKVKNLLKSLQLDALPYQNENTDPDGVEDMTALNYLHEAAILYNVKHRFLQKLPYTYTGDICIAVNPYQWIPELYSEQTQAQYRTKAREELPPHVYATSMASYNDMKRHKVNQSILVSGESGAGKTETTKILMSHLASVAGGLNDYTIQKIIEVNPLLESFGNAKTCWYFSRSKMHDPAYSSQKLMPKDRRSVFRRLGSKKDENGYDSGDASQASTAMQAALAQRSAETAQFLRQSAQRLSLWRSSGGDIGENRYSGSDMGDSGGRPSLLQEVSAARAGAIESLKNRLTAVKDKYYGEEGSSAASRQNDLRTHFAAEESLNLDALPLPSGWEMRLSRSKGKQYYCNPALRITRWDHPSIDASNAQKQGAVAAQRAKRGTSTIGSPPRDSIDGMPTMEGHI